MSLRPLHLLFAATLLIFATDAALNSAVARTTSSKHSRPHKSSKPESASPSSPGHTCTNAALTVRGDLVTSRGLVDAIADAYEKTGHGCVAVQPFNTLSGIDAALNGSADIAASARAGFSGRAQETGLNFTPVAWDALVMITSPDNPVNNLTLKQLHDIYYGQITNWQQVGGKDEPIDLYTVASPLDGAEYSLRRLLYGSGNAPVVMPRMYINVNTLEQGVALDPKALGLSTLSGVHDNQGVKIIPIEGVTPTPVTVADGSYPLYTAIYLASSPSSPHAAQIAQFMDFLATDDAKKLMRDHDLLPYTDAPTLTVQSTDQQIAAVTAKMVGEGLAPPRTIAPQQLAIAPPPGAIVSAPGATYSNQASGAPGSEATAQAQLQLAQAHTNEAPAPVPVATPQQAAGNARNAANLAQRAKLQAQTASDPVQAQQAAGVAQQAAHEAQTEALQAQAVNPGTRSGTRATQKAQAAASIATQAATQAAAQATTQAQTDSAAATPGMVAVTTPVGAKISASAKGSNDPSVKQAETVAPSNPVVISASGAAMPVQTPAANTQSSAYTVAAGDTLSKIARKYSVSVDNLREWNALKSNTLHVGQILQVASSH